MVLFVILIGLGLIVGATRHARADREVDRHAVSLMRIEVYTVNQLLAMRVKAGGGVIQAVSATVERGSGEVVSELADALRLLSRRMACSAMRSDGSAR